MAQFAVKNGVIHYEFLKSDMEHAEVLVCAHGLGLDMNCWMYLIPYLEEYDILLFDFRGHGRSSKGTIDLGWDTLFRDFISLLEHLHIVDYHYVGHGLGAHFGVELFSTFRQTCKSFTILATACYFPVDLAKESILFRRDQMLERFNGDKGLFLVKQILHNINNEKTKIIQHSFSKLTMDLYLHLLHIIIDSFNLDKLKNISMPTLILAGEFDVNYPPNLVTLSANYIPSNRVLIVPNASNMVMFDQPLIVSQWMKEFLQQTAFFTKDVYREELPYIKKLEDTFTTYSHSLRTDTKRLQVHFLGDFKVRFQENEVQGNWQRRKAKELLFFLCVRKKVLREDLYDLLWPDFPLVNAQNHLRVCLNHLKGIFQQNQLEEFLLITPREIELSCDISCDLLALLELLKQVNNYRTIQQKLQLRKSILEYIPAPILKDFYEDPIIQYQYYIENQLQQLFQEYYEHHRKQKDTEKAKQDSNILWWFEAAHT